MDALMGAVQPWAGVYVPQNWAACDGQILNIEQNMPLFSVIGTQYGGDGKKTFALPKIAPIVADTGTVQYIICVKGQFPIH